MKTTFLHTLADQVWATWRADADFAQLFARARQRDYGSLFDQPLDITAVECPLVALKLSTADFGSWANSGQLAIPVVFTVEAWFADDKQAKAIEAFAVLATPLLGQFLDRLDLAWVTQVHVGQAQFSMAPDLGDEVTRGVLSGVRFPLTFDVRRDPRNNGLYL